jgi:hypothetical protein
MERPPRTLTALSDRSLLVLAAKKAFRFLERRQWYHNRAEAIAFMARLNVEVRQLSRELRSNTYKPGVKRIFAAPKRIEREDGGERYVYRPLCTQPFRDEVVQIALVCLLAEQFEKEWGDPEEDSYPALLSYGNRLHLIKTDDDRTFSIGNSRLYRDWADDYSRFVQETETQFNDALRRLRQDQSVELLCTDVEGFYPSIDRARLAGLIRAHCSPSLRPLVHTLFGQYDVSGCGLSRQDQLDIKHRGLPQGPAYSPFWANLYLAEFDDLIKHELTRSLRATRWSARLVFYARYVDDLRIVFVCPSGRAPDVEAHVREYLQNFLSKIALRLSEKKTNSIVQNASGTLLSTGQVAERMVAIAKNVSFPLPPADLEDLANQVRFLFHADTSDGETTRDKDAGGERILDNPGVRPDSRRRFAANKWLRIARDLEESAPGWMKGQRRFASELMRVWYEDPGQTQLLQRALEIGIPSDDTSRALKRLQSLSVGPASGYYAYVLSYLLDAATFSGLDLSALPLESWAKAAWKSYPQHPVLADKSHSFLLSRRVRLTRIGASKLQTNAQIPLSLRRQISTPTDVSPVLPAVAAALTCAFSMPESKRIRLARDILKSFSAERQKRFIRALLRRQPSIALALTKANQLDVVELRAFAPVPGDQIDELQDSLDRRIVAGDFRHPLAWVDLAKELGNFVKGLENQQLAAKGIINPFSLRFRQGQLGFATDSKRVVPGYGAIPWRRGSALRLNSRPWGPALGLILRAAATAKPEHLVGPTSFARLTLAGSFAWLSRHEGKLPQAAADILDRLFAWPGSLLTGYLDVGQFLNDIERLQSDVAAASNGGISLTDVRLSTRRPSRRPRPFHVVICQIPSAPGPTLDATIRRALSMARLILQERGALETDVGLVVFPELSVPSKSIKTLRRFVRQTGALVLAGLEMRLHAAGLRQLNELLWIVPLDASGSVVAQLTQEKIHVTAKEGALRPPIVAASAPIIWRIIGPSGRFSAINCYEFTDLVLRDLIRGRVEALIIAANNQDVTTFDNLVESTHYDLFCHVVLVNSERFGGSAVRAPYRETYDRRIFDIHGSNLFAVNVCTLNLRDFRVSTPKKQTKARPAGFTLHI